MRDCDDGHLWAKPICPNKLQLGPLNDSSGDGLRPPTGKRRTSDRLAPDGTQRKRRRKRFQGFGPPDGPWQAIKNDGDGGTTATSDDGDGGNEGDSVEPYLTGFGP